MLKNTLIITFIAMSLLWLNSCGKYEEGPFFSLATKKGRVTKSWKQIEFNGTPTTTDVIWKFEGNGDFAMEYNGIPNNNPAKWSFEENKGVISIYYINDNITFDFNIIRLTSNEMWLDKVVGTSFVRIKLEKP